jgi:hypothetical protein
MGNLSAFISLPHYSCVGSDMILRILGKGQQELAELMPGREDSGTGSV